MSKNLIRLERESRENIGSAAIIFEITRFVISARIVSKAAKRPTFPI
jgi:hypothetical protein